MTMVNSIDGCLLFHSLVYFKHSNGIAIGVKLNHTTCFIEDMFSEVNRGIKFLQKFQEVGTLG